MDGPPSPPPPKRATGRAIAEASRKELGELPPFEAFANREGLGVEGTIDGHDVIVGRPALLADRGIPLTGAFEEAREAAEAQGRTSIAAAWDGQTRAVFVVADTPKPSSPEAIASLKALGLRPTATSTARFVARVAAPSS